MAHVGFSEGTDGLLGLAGVSQNSTKSGASVWVGTEPGGPVGERVGSFEIFYLKQPGGGKVRIKLDGRPAGTLNTRSRRTEPAYHTVRAKDGAHQLELEVKGIAWHPSENRLACTAGNRLFVYDLDKLDEPLEVAAFGKDLTHFTAEPVWIDGEVYLTVFEDVKTSGAADSLPKFKKEKKNSIILINKEEEVKKEKI